MEVDHSVKDRLDLCLDVYGTIKLFADRSAEIGAYLVAHARLAARADEGSVVDIHKALDVTFEGENALDDLGAVAGRARVRGIGEVIHDHGLAARVLFRDLYDLVNACKVGPELVTHIPKALCELFCDLCGSFRILADGNDGGIAVLDVKPGLHLRDREIKDLARLHIFVTLCHKAAEGLGLCGIGACGHDHGDLHVSHLGRDLAHYDAKAESRRALACLPHVNVGVSLKYRNGIRILNHSFADIGVQVEGNRDRHVGTDYLTDRNNNITLGVIALLALCRAVHNENNAVERKILARNSFELFYIIVNKRLFDYRAGLRADKAAGNDLDTRFAKNAVSTRKLISTLVTAIEIRRKIDHTLTKMELFSLILLSRSFSGSKGIDLLMETAK